MVSTDTEPRICGLSPLSKITNFARLLRVTSGSKPFPSRGRADGSWRTYPPQDILQHDVDAITFAIPSTYQIFRRFDPALGLPAEQQASKFRLVFDYNTGFAIALAGMLVLTVLGLSRVSPFLYFQF